MAPDTELPESMFEECAQSLFGDPESVIKPSIQLSAVRMIQNAQDNAMDKTNLWLRSVNLLLNVIDHIDDVRVSTALSNIFELVKTQIQEINPEFLKPDHENGKLAEALLNRQPREQC